MKAFKKIVTIVLALTIIASTSNSTFAKSGWKDYLGYDRKPGHTWYEAADGKITNIKKTGWTAALTQIGWGGIWGAQMSRQVNVVKGKKYRLKFKIKSTKVNKWVFVSASTGNNYAYGKWIWLEKGKYQTINVKFKAKKNANHITFAFGGDYGDREEMDGTKHYAYAGGAQTIYSKKDADGDSGPHKKPLPKLY